MTVMWPDFGAADLARAMEEFKQRDRRFGGVGQRDAASSIETLTE